MAMAGRTIPIGWSWEPSTIQAFEKGYGGELWNGFGYQCDAFGEASTRPDHKYVKDPSSKSSFNTKSLQCSSDFGMEGNISFLGARLSMEEVQPQQLPPGLLPWDHEFLRRFRDHLSREFSPTKARNHLPLLINRQEFRAFNGKDLIVKES